MCSGECHVIGPISEISHVKGYLKNTESKFKIVKRNDQTHVFIDLSADRSNEDVLSKFSPTWRLCPGCEYCNVATSKSKAKLRYVLYPPLIMLPTNTQISISDANDLLSQFKDCTHVAINASIKEGDRVRRPQLIPVIGDFNVFHPEEVPKSEWLKDAFYATCTQNGIYQTWAPLYTMFSRGNITEKKRVLTEFSNEAPIKDHTIIDLYAGIGYFTFSYAKQKPKRIYCWEINHWSVEGLVRASAVNKFPIRVVHEDEQYEPNDNDFIVVFLEDNQRCLERIDSLQLDNLTHVNMGLLPDAHGAFNVAHAVCNKSHLETVVHVHENVRTVEIDSWKDRMESEFGKCLKVERIKEYSPGIQHLCGDYRVSK